MALVETKVHLSSFRRALGSCVIHHNFNQKCQVAYAGTAGGVKLSDSSAS